MIQQTILYLAIILIMAKALGELAERIGQPAVLGELVAGVLLSGSIIGVFKIAPNQTLLFLAELGALLLLFEIGLESNIGEFIRVGFSSLLVSLIGMICAIGGGFLVSRLFGLDARIAIFIGVALSSTSVGITARTFFDLGRLRSREAQVIIGAAVIDDILGLIVLSVVTGVLVTGNIIPFQIIKVAFLAMLFLAGAFLIGIPAAPLLLRIIKRLRTRGMLTACALLFCLTLAYAAGKLQLAPIIGAFAAGLLLTRTEDASRIRLCMKPLADIFIPIFFVVIGMQVQLSALNPFQAQARSTLIFALALIVVAILTKALAGGGVLRRDINRLVVGAGMIPRGEVGFICASLGLARNIITLPQYTAIIAVIAATTFITPILLKALHVKKIEIVPTGEKS